VAAGRNAEGQDKQDGESNAAQRVSPRWRQAHPQLALIVGGEDLYCPAPLIGQLREQRMHHVLVGKPGSHQAVDRAVEAQDALEAWERGQGHDGPACRRRCYPSRVARGVALPGTGRVRGTFWEVWSHHRSGQQLSHNAWVTDLEVSAEHGAELVGIGRSRWQSEHEPCNVQKNHGYEWTHNYGHGQQQVSRVFDRLNLLAFLAHMLLERGDRVYQRC
jgi:hypothetical protein